MEIVVSSPGWGEGRRAGRKALRKKGLLCWMLRWASICSKAKKPSAQPAPAPHQVLQPLWASAALSQVESAPRFHYIKIIHSPNKHLPGCFSGLSNISLEIIKAQRIKVPGMSGLINQKTTEVASTFDQWRRERRDSLVWNLDIVLFLPEAQIFPISPTVAWLQGKGCAETWKLVPGTGHLGRLFAKCSQQRGNHLHFSNI